MEERPRGYDLVRQLMDKGVDIPNPLTLDVGPGVDPDRVSGDGVTIFPGCRLYGADTVISAGVTLGAEGPVTLDGCRLGPGVALKGGYFAGSVFLEGASMGAGAHVREGTLLEEEAGGAHCVGLKQTILFPFVTLGSLVNFCDCLMAGGTSRAHHSEVGSSYVHFNFTPDGDKATASMFGDVPRGVMLDQPPIFLGGQGGAVGPLVTGFGTVVAAGCVLRGDVPDDNMLVADGGLPELRRPVDPRSYRRLSRILANNLLYLANLAALREWYVRVRRPFFEAQALGPLVYEGALALLDGARAERAGRLAALVDKVEPVDEARRELRERITGVLSTFEEGPSRADAVFPASLGAAVERPGAGYVEAVRGLSPEVSAAGVGWLRAMVEELYAGAAALLPSMGLPGIEGGRAGNTFEGKA